MEAKNVAQRGGLPVPQQIMAENGVVDVSAVPQDGADARLPLADGQVPVQDLTLKHSLSVRSSGRATKPVNYNSMALGTGDVSAAMDYNNVSETTPTHTKAPGLKYGK